MYTCTCTYVVLCFTFYRTFICLSKNLPRFARDGGGGGEALLHPFQCPYPPPNIYKTTTYFENVSPYLQGISGSTLGTNFVLPPLKSINCTFPFPPPPLLSFFFLMKPCPSSFLYVKIDFGALHFFTALCYKYEVPITQVSIPHISKYQNCFKCGMYIEKSCRY